ncbi:hypothetical protein P5Y53_16190 [Dyella jiangningensis]|uniref:hypothetical protein n=1 Tax=Dyella jiangningensis TaxID=1379159 RepID=UPI0024100CF4|nr:hypothetical protein [Dyella jiangningensis]MDG2539217.1 hypothetical protein [Dyella jiangningensis]
MNDFDVVEPLVGETWVVKGRMQTACPGDVDSLHIRPLLHETGAVPLGTKVLHSLTIDNNILADWLDNRRSENTDYLENLLRSTPLELNPVVALIEQRQNYVGATQALHNLAELFGRRFDSWDAKHNAHAFDRVLEEGKSEISQNIDLMSGYLPAILYIYHQKGSAESKLEWLSGLIQELDLPYLQLPFYLGALLFLVKDHPALFRGKLVSKVRKDTKLESDGGAQRRAIRNLTHDVMLPALALFTAGTQATMVFPYIATRDYLVQDFICEVRCGVIEVLPDGRANGAWELNPTGQLQARLAPAIARHLPRRHSPSSKEQLAVRRANLRAFADSYLEKCVAQR